MWRRSRSCGGALGVARSRLPPASTRQRLMARPNASGSALEWLTESDTIERESAKTRLRDSSSALLGQYAELLKLGEISTNEVVQQVRELRSSVLATGIVQSADTLLQLESDLQRSALLSDHAQIADEVASLTAAHASAAADGTRRLRAVAVEMQAALRELEASYYNSRVSVSVSQSDGMTDM